MGLLWWLAGLWHGRVRIEAQREDSNGEGRECHTEKRATKREGTEENHREKRQTNGV